MVALDERITKVLTIQPQGNIKEHSCQDISLKTYTDGIMVAPEDQTEDHLNQGP